MAPELQIQAESAKLRWARWLAGWSVEALIVIGVIFLYQLTKLRAVADQSLAMAHGEAIIALEKKLGMFVEPAIHQFFVQDTGLIPILRLLYIHMHFPATLGFLIWVRARRRDWYPSIRNGFALAHVVALVVFVLYPCAPPRFFPHDGFVDILALPYKTTHNPYAVIPSMHYGYASLVGIGLIWLGRSVWLRALGVAYMLLVLLIIVSTAAHFIIDAPLGTAVVMGGLAVCGAFRVRPAKQPEAPDG